MMPPLFDEDEAFVRAVVDAPGDDAPRLVYADWLDEQGDLRGAYLRAAAAWCQRLRDVEMRDKAERQLRHAGRALDPVWVCRVTPPPLGVCCDRVRFSDCGTPIPAGRIDQLEARLRVRLPAAYRAFLLNYNGGIPEPDVCDVGYYGFSRVQAFFALGEWMTNWPGPTPDDSLERFAERLNAGFGRITLFPIGAAVHSHRVTEDLEEDIREATSSRPPPNTETCLCITLETHEVVLARIYLEAGVPANRVPHSTRPVASSLPALLNQLDEIPDGWEPED